MFFGVITSALNIIRIHANVWKVSKELKNWRYLALISKPLCRDSLPKIYDLARRNRVSV